MGQGDYLPPRGWPEGRDALGLRGGAHLLRGGAACRRSPTRQPRRKSSGDRPAARVASGPRAPRSLRPNLGVHARGRGHRDGDRRPTPARTRPGRPWCSAEERRRPCPRSGGEPASSRHCQRAWGRGRIARRAALPRFFAAWPHAWAGLVFAHLGRFAEAIEHATEAVTIAESADHAHTVIESYGALGGVSLEQGDLASALHAFENGMALIRRRNVADPNIISGLGYVYALSGRLAEALPLLEASIVGEASISAMGLGLAVRLTRLAEAYLLAGRTAEAADRAGSAVDLARKHKERANEALALRAFAEIMVQSDRPDAGSALRHYEASLALAQEIGMRPLTAHGHFGLGKLYVRAGKRQQAAEQLAIATTIYRELGMNAWVARSEQALQELA
ncbi:MAG: hypothetical protein DME02_23275 [Candidatus Rokuibacteriota bacterium]|nr:MAG: hypothetical protein DME02_23275 [Candidatus Rokubacteria bacterium]